MPQPLPDNVNWLALNRGAQLAAALLKERVELSVDAALRTLMAADPSPGHHGTQWLCDTYIGGGYRWEDLQGGTTSKAGETLALFAQVRPALEPVVRNLASHASLAGLWRAIEPHVQGQPSTGGRAARRLARLEAYRDSVIVYQNPDMLVAVPLTRAASCWWGRGTRWCTASRDNNMFKRYHESAPLVVIVLRDQVHDEVHGLAGNGPASDPPLGAGNTVKLQIHVGRDEVAFMDAADAEVTPQFVQRNWSMLEPLMTWVADAGGDITQFVPQHLWSASLIQAMVRANGEILEQVPLEHKTRPVCLAAVGNNGLALEHVPPELRDQEICGAAVSNYGVAIRYVPEHLLSDSMCMAAITRTGSALEYIDEHRRTPVLCSQAVVKNGFAIVYVPAQYRTSAMCMDAVISTPDSIVKIPKSEWTHELLMAAVVREGLTIGYIHSPHLSPALCRAAVQQNPGAFEFIPAEMRTYELSMMAVRMDGRMLRHVPATLVDAELCRMAVEQSGDGLRHVPARYLTPALCKQAIEYNESYALQYVPKSMWTRDMVVDSIVMAPWHISDIPSHYIDADFLQAVATHQSRILGYINKEMQTLEMCTAVVRANPQSMHLVCPSLHDAVMDACKDVLDTRRAQVDAARPKWMDTPIVDRLGDCLRRSAVVEPVLVDHAQPCLGPTVG